MRVEFSAQAKSDLVSIGLFIAGDNPFRARSFIVELREACRSLPDAPDRFVQVKRLPNGSIRRMPHRAYSIFYLVRKDIILILRIVHGAVVTGSFMEDLA